MKGKSKTTKRAAAKATMSAGMKVISPSTLRAIKDDLLTKAAAVARETAPLFKAMGWRYSSAEGLRHTQRSGINKYVPDENDIHLTICGLVSHLSEVIVEERTGRFRVGYEPDEMGGYHGFIVFEPERWQTETVS